jgi:hypothetical protein
MRDVVTLLPPLTPDHSAQSLLVAHSLWWDWNPIRLALKVYRITIDNDRMEKMCRILLPYRLSLPGTDA